MNDPKGTCTYVCLRLKGMIIGSRLMNRFGWAVVTTLSLIMFIFTGLSISLPWWAIDFTNHCSGYYLVLMLRDGMCTTDSSQVPETDGSKCIAWHDEDGWRAVDEESGANTEHEVSHIYPLILEMTYMAIAVLFLQLGICVYQWRFLVENIWLQRIVLLLTVWYLTIQSWINSIGPDTSVTDKDTWRYTNDCSEATSYPGFGDIFPVIAAYLSWVVLFIVNFPEKCWYI